MYLNRYPNEYLFSNKLYTNYIIKYDVSILKDISTYIIFHIMINFDDFKILIFTILNLLAS